MPRETFESLHRHKTGKASDKWASYLPFYDGLFAASRDLPVSVLEIGVQNGGSLETYAAYFEQGRRFVGCDIDPRCAALAWQDPRIHLVLGDANSLPVCQAIRSLSESYEFIIDDGSHTTYAVLASFLLYFPLLRPGGVYVIEDTCTLYWPSHGGGLQQPGGALPFFRRLADVVNHSAWCDDLGLADFMASGDLAGVPAFLGEGWVDGIEFRNSLIVVRKARVPGHDKLGERLIRGREFAVAPPPPAMLSASPATPA